MAVGASYYTELLTATREGFVTQDLTNQVLTQHPLLELFSSSIKSGTGTQLLVPVIGAELGTSAWAADASGTFSTAVDGDIMGNATIDWSNALISPTRLEFMNIAKNSGGKTQVQNLVVEHLEAAKRDHAKKLATALHAAVPAAGAPLSLAVLIDDTTTVQGINPASKTYWKSTVRNSDSADESIKVAFRRLADDIYIASGGVRPTHILAGLDVFQEYEDSLDEATRAVMTSSSSALETRFRELKFQDVVVRLDPDCPADTAYFLNKDDLVAFYLDDNWMRVASEQQIVGTLDLVTPIVSVVAFGVKARRTHGKLVRTVTP